MKKMFLFLALCCLFISFVLIKVMKTGVRLPERPMVKWSQVESAEKLSHRLTLFLFPLLKESKKILVAGDSEFANQLFHASERWLKKNNIETLLQKSLTQIVSKDDFFIRILPLDKESFTGLCRDNINYGCTGLKALKKFNKKQRASDKIWVTMYRLADKEAVLFFTNPSLVDES